MFFFLMFHIDPIYVKHVKLKAIPNEPNFHLVSTREQKNLPPVHMSQVPIQRKQMDLPRLRKQRKNYEFVSPVLVLQAAKQNMFCCKCIFKKLNLHFLKKQSLHHLGRKT